ncbi:MAG: PepSY domain-containing protein [Lachnospiraceae bacterium]|nr:PepSY domain-containing protein [Lachnospiraceae bacterium]
MGKLRKATISIICIAEALLIIGSTAACGAKDGGAAPQESVQTDEIPQETVQPKETQQETVQSNETMQTTAQPNVAQQNTNKPVLSDDRQISLEDAKSAALADAGVSDADVIYTKQKSDYEDGIMVYDIEFYAGNMEYEYEINAATGEVYSKSVDAHYDQTGHGHNGHNGHTTTSDSYIGADSAETVALNHAGFSETEVGRLKSEFDIDDGIAVYEVEFDKDGREYEYKINAIDGSIIEYDID